MRDELSELMIAMGLCGKQGDSVKQARLRCTKSYGHKPPCFSDPIVLDYVKRKLAAQ